MAKRKPISTRTRFEIFKRDSFTCQYCGRKAPEIILEVDHINPVANGGKNDFLNLVTSCGECNAGKSDRSLSDDSAVALTHRQAQSLQARREQIKMMADWYSGLNAIEDEQMEIIQSQLSRLSGMVANQNGRSKISKIIKKHGLPKTIQFIQSEFASCPHQDANAFERCFTRFEKAIKFSTLPPEVAKSRYLVGVVRNRFPKCWDWYPKFERLFTKILSDDLGEYRSLYNTLCAAVDIQDARDESLEIGQNLGFSYGALSELWNAE